MEGGKRVLVNICSFFIAVFHCLYARFSISRILWVVLTAILLQNYCGCGAKLLLLPSPANYSRITFHTLFTRIEAKKKEL
jgi:hypothetical protein